MEFLIWSFTVFGLTNILSISKIFAPVRYKLLYSKKTVLIKLGQLLNCTMCTGFWVGIFLHIIGLPVTWLFLLDGFAASGVCWLLHAICYHLCLMSIVEKGVSTHLNNELQDVT